MLPFQKDRPLVILTQQLNKLREELEEMKRKKSELIFKRHDMIAAGEMQRRIEATETKIKEFEEYEPKKLSEMMPKSTLKKADIAKHIVTTHIFADVFNNAVFTLRSELRKLGLEGCSLFYLADKMEEMSRHYAALVCKDEFMGLSEFLQTDDKLVDDLTTLCRLYLNEHLNIT